MSPLILLWCVRAVLHDAVDPLWLRQQKLSGSVEIVSHCIQCVVQQSITRMRKYRPKHLNVRLHGCQLVLFASMQL